MRVLLDVSSLLNIVRARGSGALQYLRGNYVLSLTPYEVGDALWKEAALMKRLTIDEAVTLLSLISKA